MWILAALLVFSACGSAPENSKSRSSQEQSSLSTTSVARAMDVDLDGLIGLSLAEAKQRLEDAGLEVKVARAGQMTSGERKLDNRVLLVVKDGTVRRAYKG